MTNDAHYITLVSLKDYSLRYDTRAVFTNLTLELKPRSTYALLGPSGCGKTSLLYAIANLLPANAVIKGDKHLKQNLKISTVLQEYGLFPWKTVYENTILPLQLGQVNSPKKLPQDIQIKAMKLLEQLGLGEHKNHYPNALSGGQKQRVAIARAGLTSPDLLLLDEPFSSLDALTREDLQDQLKATLHQSDISLFLVTHSIEEAVFLAETILIMDDTGNIRNLINNSDYRQAHWRENNAYFMRIKQIRKLLKGDYDDTDSTPSLFI